MVQGPAIVKPRKSVTRAAKTAAAAGLSQPGKGQVVLIGRRTFFELGFAGLVTAGSRAVAGPVPAAPAVDLAKYLNREYLPYLPLMRMSAAEPPMSAENLLERRKPAANAMSTAFLSTPTVEEKTIAGPKGAPDVHIYVINAGARDKTRPAILHMHFGGFVVSDAKTSVRSLQEIAAELDCVIVTVDYRLSPEAHFPGPVEDNYAALKWLYANASALGVDGKRIAVMGESAGGGHAAMLAIVARDRGEVPVIFQCLTYPMLDDRTGSTKNLPPYLGAVVWRPADNRFGWTAFLGVPAGSASVPYGAVPARVKDLKGLPPAFIAVGSLDLFAEEDIEYTRRLLEAGISTELLVIPGVVHGFDFVPTNVAKQFRATRLTALKNAFATA